MKTAVCVKGERPESIRVYKTGCPSLAYSCADCQVSIALAGLEGGLQRERLHRASSVVDGRLDVKLSRIVREAGLDYLQ